MRIALFCLLASSCLLASNATAADLGPIEPSASSPTAEPVSFDGRRFYVRGDVGLGRISFGGFSQEELEGNGGSFISESIGDPVILGAGLGWRMSPNLRLDVTGEYRSKVGVKGLDYLDADLINPNGHLKANTLYQGDYSAVVGLLNGYWDIGTWNGFTPYLGAGIGIARNEMSGFTTTSSSTFVASGTGTVTTQATSGVAEDSVRTSLAWALMAGTSYDLSPNAKLDIGYRYLDLGSGATAETGLIDCVCGTVGQPLEAHDMTDHEIRIGIRWEIGDLGYAPDHQPLK